MHVMHAFATRDPVRRIAGDLGAVAFTIAVSCFLLVGIVGATSGAWKLVVMVPLAAVSGFTLWSGYDALTRRCFWIRIGVDGSCEARAPLRRTRIQAGDVLAVEVSPASHFWYSGDEPTRPDNTKVVHRNGSVILVQPIDRFEELLPLLEPVSPAADR